MSRTKCQVVYKPGTQHPNSQPIDRLAALAEFSPGPRKLWEVTSCVTFGVVKFTRGFSTSPVFSDTVHRDILFVGDSKRHSFRSEF